MTCSDNTCGTGIGSVILPGDPSNDSILTALPVFGGVELSWQLPSTNSFAVAYTKVWRSYTNNFNGSLMIAQAAGDRFFDRNDFMNGIFSTLYYWIQFVSVNGTIGDPIGPAAAMPMPTIDQILQQLTAKIDYGALSVELKSTVDKADLYKQAQDAVNTALDTEQINIRDALALVQSDVENTFVLISNEVTARQSAEQAFASSINTLAVATEENLATAQTTLQTSIDSVTEDVSAMYTAKLTVNGLIGGFGLINDGDTVEAGFDVDTFWVGRTQQNKKKPFIISGGVVYIDSAAIKDGSITSAKIEDASIVAAKIQDLSVGTAKIANLAVTNAKINDINASKITAGFIDAARINAGTINADMIVSKSATSFQQSSNYMADDEWVSFSFYMYHDGYVSVIGAATWAYSGSDGSGSYYISITDNATTTPTSYTGGTSSWYSSAAPSVPTLMYSRYCYTGWNKAWLKIHNSLANAAHYGQVAIFMSYR